MALYLANDDPNNGAPYARCGLGKVMLLLAPANCDIVPGVVWRHGITKQGRSGTC